MIAFTSSQQMPFQRFQLEPAFVASYKTRRPPFGFNGLGELAYLRTYSRLKQDGTNEVWFETVQRVVEGTYNMQKRWILSNRLHWDERKAQRSAQEMYERMFSMKFLPPGRGLWAMGSPLTEERGLHASLLNCAFVSTENLGEDKAEPFTFLMDASMLGIGVGFDTKGAGTLTVTAPGVGSEDKLVIPDTREGWVQSVELLLQSYFSAWPETAFDYSLIRPAGEPIRGFGGVAAGAEPLMRLHTHIRDILTPLIGQTITTTAIVDLMNVIGKCVVAGNVRRTAEIAFGAHDSAEFLDLKNYDVNPHRADYGWTSNNSIQAPLGMDYTDAARRVVMNGEPGFLWLENVQAYGRMRSEPTWADIRAQGANPCVEQSLESYECCCLCETFPANHESLSDYLTTLKYAYLYAKTVTLGTTPWPRTNAVMLRNRRIGLSQSGIAQAVDKLGIHTYKHWCEEGYDTVQEYDVVYSDWFAIPRSIKTTSIKPSGTVSLLAGATPGMHWPESRYYIRRMRLSVLSDLIGPLRVAGYVVEPCVGDESSVVVEVPVAIDQGVREAHEVSMWEQLALAAFLQAYWSDNQVSATITFDPATEGPQLAHALNYYQYQLKGVSFLPRLEAGAYAQMPYEAITAWQYFERVEQLTPITFGTTHEKAETEKYCDGDKCTL